MNDRQARCSRRKFLAQAAALTLASGVPASAASNLRITSSRWSALGASRRQMLPGFHYLEFYTDLYESNQFYANHGCVVLSITYAIKTKRTLNRPAAHRLSIHGKRAN